MHGDAEERRFFAYLNLFVFSMLLLVLAGNFVFLLAGWGLVGLSSYLLIGFWWQRPSAVAAAKKAFVMNAIGDVGMALGIFVIWNHLRHGRLSRTVFALAPSEIGGGLVDRQLDRACCCSSPRSRSRRSCRCTRGCRTPWRARPRSPP